MLGLRRIATAAATLIAHKPSATCSRLYNTRSIRLTGISSRNLSPLSSRIGHLRAYATSPEDQSEQHDTLADEAKETVSNASDSTREALRSTQETASNTASKAGNVVQDAAGSVRWAASNAAESISKTAQDGMGTIAPGSVASSAQTSPVRTAADNVRQEASKNLYVGNLYFEVSQEALKAEFSRYGEVVNAKVIYDGRGLSKGFGYVEFANIEDANAAKQALNQVIFEGRRMTVQYAISSEPKNLPPRDESGFRHAPSRTLYIGNLSYEMTDKDLNDLFRPIRNVLDVRVAVDRRTGQPRGYAHADFLDVESATKAAEYIRSKTFYNRVPRVDYTHSKFSTRDAPPQE